MITNTPYSQSPLGNAIVKAQRFLLESRGKDGYWNDFKTLAGSSNEWVSAYVVTTLARYGNEEGKRVASTVFRKLSQKRFWLAGWGYNGKVPPDADSTGWMLMAAQNLSVNTNWRLKRAERFMDAHTGPEGGIHTYYNSKAIRLFTRLNRSNVSFDGWCMAHTCVTAAFAAYKGINRQRLIHYLLNRQEKPGYWKSYWWTDDLYATALATEALSGTEQAGQEACERALNWLEQINIIFTPFRAALSMRIRLSQPEPDKEKLKKTLDYLLTSQLPDGSWAASAFLRIPPPFITHPEHYEHWVEDSGGGGSYQNDKGRIFTTATVLTALGKFSRIY